VIINEGILVIGVQGRIDTCSASDFQQKVDEALCRTESRIVMDFQNLEYISSAGLRDVIFAAKKAKTQQREICCCSLQKMVKEIFDISGFSHIIAVYDSMDEATKVG
jgi:anti-sigma B factor antagonist